MPIFSKEIDLSEDSKKIYNLLVKKDMASGAIVKATGFGKNKVVQILNELVEKGYVKKSGTGRGTTYNV